MNITITYVWNEKKWEWIKINSFDENYTADYNTVCVNDNISLVELYLEAKKCHARSFFCIESDTPLPQMDVVRASEQGVYFHRIQTREFEENGFLTLPSFEKKFTEVIKKYADKD